MTYYGQIETPNGVREVEVEAAGIRAAYQKVAAMCGEREHCRGVVPIEDDDA
jgi:hypothetical protein